MGSEMCIRDSSHPSHRPPPRRHAASRALMTEQPTLSALSRRHSADEIARIASPQLVDAPHFPPLPWRAAPCSIYRWLISPMFLVVFGIVVANYLPYVLWTPHATVGAWVAVGVFHVLLALLLGSYLMTVFTDPGTVPAEWNAAVAADERLSAMHRYCERSGLYRPLRSHYCSVTGRVVLNMDHFCPWVVNTVGFYNRKFFVLFLFYTLLTCTWVLVTFIPTMFDARALFIPAHAGSRRHGGLNAFTPNYGNVPSPHSIASLGWGPTQFMVLMMAVMLDVTLMLMLLCFFSFHASMICKNETTIEGACLPSWICSGATSGVPLRGPFLANGCP